MGILTWEQYIKLGLTDRIYEEKVLIFTLHCDGDIQKATEVINFLESNEINYVAYNFQEPYMSSIVVRRMKNWRDIKKLPGIKFRSYYFKNERFILTKNDTDGAIGNMIEIF